MSLAQEFKRQAEALNFADFQVVSSRLSGLLEWMEFQPEIKSILDQLRASPRFEQLFVDVGFQKPPQARTTEEIAMVGLALMDACKTGQELWNVAMSNGITARGAGNSIAPHSDAALEQYIQPLLNYVIRKLPAEAEVPTSASSGRQNIPVAIQESLEQFRKDNPDPRKTCFIMMRFGNTSAHEGIENAIKSVLKKYNFTGLLARDKEYCDDLYPNIQTYMHGCGFGIAVFERIESEDFNPNVSLEVGYLLGLRRPVLLLKDKTLETLHTDLVGKLYRSFDPLHPEASIPKQVEQWLEDKGLV